VYRVVGEGGSREATGSGREERSRSRVPNEAVPWRYSEVSVSFDVRGSAALISPISTDDAASNIITIIMRNNTTDKCCR